VFISALLIIVSFLKNTQIFFGLRKKFRNCYAFLNPAIGKIRDKGKIVSAGY
jgi:hypothetical protein